jgi:hypothetical protein
LPDVRKSYEVEMDDSELVDAEIALLVQVLPISCSRETVNELPLIWAFELLEAIAVPSSAAFPASEKSHSSVKEPYTRCPAK